MEKAPTDDKDDLNADRQREYCLEKESQAYRRYYRGERTTEAQTDRMEKTL